MAVRVKRWRPGRVREPDRRDLAALQAVPGWEASGLAAARRILIVHAHPDDETINAGALLAALGDAGRAVAVVAATRGERGEIVPGTLPPDFTPAQLSRAREAEARRALHELGPVEHTWLGTPPARVAGAEPTRYEDSGMRWLRPGLAGPAADAPPAALTRRPVDDEVADLRAYLDDWRPDLLITCDPGGGYGHPDHRRISAVARRAAAAAGCRALILAPVPEDDVPALPRDPARTLPLEPWRPRLVAALRCYRSQLTVVGDRIRHVGGQRQPIVADVELQDAPAV
jgi:N-acetyl-1-D-myo-inositol-2-amino-2-deoxy-alpha-D-glucopyranoside deacetylase